MSTRQTRTLVSILILVFAVLIIVGSCATGKKIITVDDAMKKFEGIWINTEYAESDFMHPQMFIITSDGGIEYRQLSTKTIPTNQGKYTVAESWTDSKGNIYSTVDTKWKIGWHTQELWKLDKSGNILETNYKLTMDEEYPTKIDPNPDPNAFTPIYYCIYYRQ
jgi:hypothetical protein